MKTDIKNIIELVNEELMKTKSSYYYTQFGFMSDRVDALEKLKAILEKKAKDDSIDLNVTVDVEQHSLVFQNQPSKAASLLNIAVTYCKADVVKYLLDNGAVADNKTIHHACKQYNADMNNVIGVLEEKHVDLNSLNKKGQTALYVATRKHKDKAVAALSNHHANMLFFERIKAPILNTIDKVNEVKDNVELAIFAPGLRGC